MKVAIAFFTDNGHNIARQIIDSLGFQCSVYDKQQGSAKDFISHEFKRCKAIIFIGAVGIAVRLIAKHISSKETDPAVLVIDEKANYVIPILSGHIGGANFLARKVAGLLNSVAVITTATDLNACFAVDVWSVANQCAILDCSKIKHISASLLRKEKVGWVSDFKVNGKRPDSLCPDVSTGNGIVLSLDTGKRPYTHTLNIMPRILTLGVGCKKNTDAMEFENFVLNTLNGNNLSLKAVRAIASIDLKKNEQCINYFADKYKLPFVTYSAQTLAETPGNFSSSCFVKSVTGVDNVCERAAVINSNGTLLVPKTFGNGLTMAVAASGWEGFF